MRILFTFIGGNGHFQPLAPVARAAVDAGHTVAVAGSGKLVSTVVDAGFTAFATSEPAGRGSEAGAKAGARTPLRPIDKEQSESDFADSFARRGARRHAAAILDLVRRWTPDVVVRDEADFGAAIAAEHEQIPCAAVMVLAAGTLLRKDLVAGPLGELRSEYGLPSDPALAMLERNLVLAPFPQSFRDPDFPLPDRSFSYRPRASAPVGTRSDPPLVYFTLGTVFNRQSGDLFERVLSGLATLPARIVVTVGHHIDPLAFGPQPDHVRIERFVPQDTLLSTCDLVVSHGGSGSLMGALAHGVPSVLAPMGADQPHNAERAVDLGVARALEAYSASPDDVRDAVSAVLADNAYRSNAQRIQSEINGQPGPEATVPVLEELVE